MKFSEIDRYFKIGVHIKRKCWNGGEFLFKEKCLVDGIVEERIFKGVSDAKIIITNTLHFDISYWVPTQQDLTEDDWYIDENTETQKLSDADMMYYAFANFCENDTENRCAMLVFFDKKDNRFDIQTEKEKYNDDGLITDIGKYERMPKVCYAGNHDLIKEMCENTIYGSLLEGFKNEIEKKYTDGINQLKADLDKILNNQNNEHSGTNQRI